MPRLRPDQIIFLVAFALLAIITIGAAAVSSSGLHLFSLHTTTGTTSAVSGLEIVNNGGVREVGLLEGCSANQILKFTASNRWDCANDLTSASTGSGSSLALDLGGNGSLESTSLVTIATTGSDVGCFSESPADTFLITTGCSWPLAALATALAANGSNCAAGQAPLGVDASGAVESCTAYVPTSTGWTTSAVTADVTNNTTTLADATGLSFSTTANTGYTIRLRVFATATAAGDFKFRLTHSGTTTRVYRVPQRAVAGGTGAEGAPSAAFDSSDATIVSASTGSLFYFEDLILQVGASGGIVNFQFAENSSDAGPCTIYEGSYIEYAKG